MAELENKEQQPTSPGGLSHRDMTSVPKRIEKQHSNPPEGQKTRKRGKHARGHSKISQNDASRVEQDGTSVNTSKRSKRKRKRRHS